MRIRATIDFTSAVIYKIQTTLMYPAQTYNKRSQQTNKTATWAQTLQYLILMSYTHHLVMNKTLGLLFKDGSIRRRLMRFINSGILYSLLHDCVTIQIRLKQSLKGVLIL